MVDSLKIVDGAADFRIATDTTPRVDTTANGNGAVHLEANGAGAQNGHVDKLNGTAPVAEKAQTNRAAEGTPVFDAKAQKGPKANGVPLEKASFHDLMAQFRAAPLVEGGLAQKDAMVSAGANPTRAREAVIAAAPGPKARPVRRG